VTGGEAVPAVPAATAVLVRDGERGLEALMVRRDSSLAFAGGMWVFPGGRVDAGDHPADHSGAGRENPELAAARRAAAREVAEESGLVVQPESLVAFSHWTPPPITPKRYSTWFFIAPAPEGQVTVDGIEIREHRWMRPSDAIERRESGEIELAPPTWITLWQLSRFADVRAALAQSRLAEPEAFCTRISPVEGGAVALYHGDVAYEDAGEWAAAPRDAAHLGSAVNRPGPRHRLWMLPNGWRYERSG
jgi:8-oxo-dGTP pyrophosphatase MutT (NUDIX family)